MLSDAARAALAQQDAAWLRLPLRLTSDPSSMAAHLLTGHGEQPGHELTSAVAAILRTPDAEARWRQGEDVLSDVATGPPIPPAFAAEIRQMAAFVAPTL